MHECQKSAGLPSHILPVRLSRNAVSTAVRNLRCSSALESPRQGFSSPWQAQVKELQDGVKRHPEWSLGQLSEGLTR